VLTDGIYNSGASFGKTWASTLLSSRIMKIMSTWAALGTANNAIPRGRELERKKVASQSTGFRVYSMVYEFKSLTNTFKIQNTREILIIKITIKKNFFKFKKTSYFSTKPAFNKEKEEKENQPKERNSQQDKVTSGKKKKKYSN